jgi:hypothetical protein
VVAAPHASSLAGVSIRRRTQTDRRDGGMLCGRPSKRGE